MKYTNNTAAKSAQSKLAKMLTIGFLATATMALYTTNGIAQTAPKHELLALSKKDHTLAIVDPVSLKVIARVPVGPDPHEVIASADGTTAYVSNMGNGGNEYHELDVIDLVKHKALPAVNTHSFTGLHGLDFQGGKVWFTAQGAKAVGYYDPATKQIDWSMGTGQDRTHMIYVTPDTKRVYTTNVAAGTVSILEYVQAPPHKGPGGPGGPGGPKGPGGPGGPDGKLQMEWRQTVVYVSKGSEGFDVSPDGKELWTASSEDGTIAVIDLDTKKVIATIDAQVLGANRLKFTPDGKRALITSLRTGDLFIYDVATRKELKKITTGHGAAGILVDTDGSRAFIGCTSDDYVAIVDLKKMEMTGHIDVGGNPDGLAWAIVPGK